MTEEQRQYNGERTAFSTNGPRTTRDSHGRKKKNLDTDLTLLTKINSQLIINLNVKFKNYETSRR